MNVSHKIQTLFAKPVLAKIQLSLLPAPKIKNWEIFVGSVLIATLSYGLFEYLQLQTQVKQLNAKLSKLQYQQGVSKSSSEEVNPEESVAVVEAITKLNYAWDHVFKALEKARMPETSILEISSNVQSQQIDIVAQTTNLQLMLEYIKKVKSLPFISRVVLNSDEIQDNQLQPVLFHITLTWY